jgi:hypothetical protein
MPARFNAAIIAIYVVLGAAFAFVVPPGEAPDEPAHFEYARTIAETHRLPSPLNARGLGYEAHQPPLDYLVDAVVIAATSPAIRFEPRTAFNSHVAGDRAFNFNASERDVVAFRVVRIIHLMWGALAIAAALALVRRLGGNGEVAAALLLGPQFLFITAMVNNDALLIALSSLVVLGLVRLLEEPSIRGAMVTALFFGLALFTKGSALFLLVPIILATLFLRRDANKTAIALIVTSKVLLLLWLAMNFLRGGHAMPDVPSAGEAGELQWIVRRPGWVATLFRSFWAKFGVMNTALPIVFYLWFAALSLVVAVGMIRYLRQRQKRDVSLLLLATVGANLALIVAFMLRVDWQPQGRYLFPSIAAIAGFASVGAERIPRSVARLLPLISIAIALFSIAWVRHLYPSG